LTKFYFLGEIKNDKQQGGGEKRNYEKDMRSDVELTLMRQP
jgi:hypothetical protein